ncbi:MAG: undecaprenyl-diphosphate phosphatase [Thermoguttaceae bacterium]|nr:undecaprenyl-diphosphate phosphatase [Thermoguttaceae bacterium]
MTPLIKIIILAIVQGIAEFLPISSSGHLEVISEALDEFAKFELNSGLDSLTVSVVLHLGTLMSLLVFYWRTLLDIVLKLRFKLAFLLILASIPAALAGVLLHDFFEDNLSNLWIIGCMFILTAFLLIASQKFSRRKTEIDESEETPQAIESNGSAETISEELSSVSWGQALVIGIFQMFAILPGLSRSGSTIAGGLFSGLKQSAAANFSFLMAIPVIGGAGLLELLKLIKRHQAIPVTELSIGFLVSFVVGLLALYWVISWIKKGKLNWFAYWLFLMAAFSFCLAMF